MILFWLLWYEKKFWLLWYEEKVWFVVAPLKRRRHPVKWGVVAPLDEEKAPN